MNERKSKLNKLECKVLHRKMGEVQVLLLEYLGNGCPPTGFQDDMHAMVGLIDLAEYIKTIRERK